MGNAPGSLLPEARRKPTRMKSTLKIPTRKTEGAFIGELIREAASTPNAHDNIGVIDVDAGTVTIAPRDRIQDPHVGPIIPFTMATIIIDGGVANYGRILLPLPSPWELVCEQCSQPARIILSRRNVDPAAPIHPRCQDHLAPGSAAAIDRTSFGAHNAAEIGDSDEPA